MALNTGEAVDYVAVARHNFGSARIPVSVEILDPDASPAVWTQVVSPVMLPNDGPALFRFTPQGIASVRLRLGVGNAAASAAVVYAGKLLVVPRRIYVGHTPITYARATKVTNARSESGDFLGRIVLNEMTHTSVDLQNLLPGWYRSQCEPFL